MKTRSHSEEKLPIRTALLARFFVILNCYMQVKKPIFAVQNLDNRCNRDALVLITGEMMYIVGFCTIPVNVYHGGCHEDIRTAARSL
jgi:hypothetical protein